MPIVSEQALAFGHVADGSWTYMLPDIDANDRSVGYDDKSACIDLTTPPKPRTQQRILVRSRHDLKLGSVGVIPEPAPARALDTGSDGVHFGLEGCENNVRSTFVHVRS